MIDKRYALYVEVKGKKGAVLRDQLYKTKYEAEQLMNLLLRMEKRIYRKKIKRIQIHTVEVTTISKVADTLLPDKT